jgi:tRNA(Leu) C34 or U34 (ribose-2'-O)-methylase TrmL
MKKMNGRYPKPYKWNEQSQKYRATNCSYWEGLKHHKCDKVKKCKQDKFGRKLKQSTKKAKKVECPFNLKEMKEFFKCGADFKQAKKTLNSVQWRMEEV